MLGKIVIEPGRMAVEMPGQFLSLGIAGAHEQPPDRHKDHAVALLGPGRRPRLGRDRLVGDRHVLATQMPGEKRAHPLKQFRAAAGWDGMRAALDLDERHIRARLFQRGVEQVACSGGTVASSVP